MEYRSGVPRYVQIAEVLRARLRGEGERIRSEHQLCAEFEVSRPTVRQALDVLVQEGLLYRHAGRGTFSTPAPGGDPRLRVIGSTLRSRPILEKAALVAEFQDQFGGALAEGRLRPVIGAEIPLEKAGEAHRLMESSKHFGKIALRVRE